ncbi:hypothetical protein cypCar_00032817 [Cyprinus carpio]|nr:hypothetical protein cypCar_00032817 [Cyprinus carpio]
MASDKVLLLNSLKDLREAELKEFQWHLKNDHESISESEMEKADRLKTVDKMVECFGPEEALKITVKILKKMNQNSLAVELENKHKQGQAEDRNEDPAPVIAESKPTEDSHQLTLDLNTVNEYLHLSENNRVITGASTELQSYPDHPDRFDHWRQVLCRESVCGRCYWEIERSGDYVSISVSYKSISRKGSGDENEMSRLNIGLILVRASTGEKWHKRHLTYHIMNGPHNLSPSQVHVAVKMAFQLWSNVSVLIFQELQHGPADIRLAFEGEHNDGTGNAFDGPGDSFFLSL